ncbi:MAG: DUF2252 domain-containing protein [Burkholderiales bacterium]|nr:DUF2252 domain-containing protein [Burkholderiales bacterium]
MTDPRMRPRRDSKPLAHVDQFIVPRATVDERFAAGKALREKLPRERHADYVPAPARADPVDILQAQNATRLPQLVPVRHARMLESAFAFLRGSAAVAAADLAGTPTTGLTVQACGDMHVSNFGVYASAERRLLFGINDFDETLPAPWEWDLKRLAASAAVVARHLGGKNAAAADAARQVTRSYRQHVRAYARMGYLEIWYKTIDEDDVLAAVSDEARRRGEKVMAKARNRTHTQVLEKMADLVDDQHHIVEQRPFIVRETHTEHGQPVIEALDDFLQSYLGSIGWDRRRLLEQYRIIDVARKVVGVGSVGTRCWVIMLLGVDDDDPLFLQVKEAQPSVLQPYRPSVQAFANEGHRVVAGQRLIQSSPDIFLGWGELRGVQFYVRQLRDMKGGTEFREGRTDLDTLPDYCRLCGWALALAHAKSGDAAKIAGYVGKSDDLDEAIANFSLAYADQTERDYEQFARAVRRGRIKVAEGRA